MKAIQLKQVVPALILATSSVLGNMQVERTVKTTTTVSEYPPYATQYANRVNFGIPRLGYERIKPDSVYFGIEAWRVYRLGNATFEKDILEAEARVGYNFFFDGREHFTPIIGGGYFKDFARHRQRKQGIAYGTFGFLYDHEFNSVFNLGVNMKGLVGYTVNKHGHVKKHDWSNPILGYDLGLPFTFRFESQRHWDVRLEPFLIQMFTHHATHNFGGLRASLGYRF